MANESENIDIPEFVNARSREIEAIEKSLSVSHKKSLFWQKCPYYRRRRSRCFDQRKKKRTHRRKDRHFLRTHTYYAKRFFMLKLSYCSVPVSRRVKSSKFIYKSQSRGFLFDETFRRGYVYDREAVLTYLRSMRSVDDTGRDSCQPAVPYPVDAHFAPSSVTVDPAATAFVRIDFDKVGVVQEIQNCWSAVVTSSEVVVIGGSLPITPLRELECVIAVYRKSGYPFEELMAIDGVQVYPGEAGSIESHKIFCTRQNIMPVYQLLTDRHGFIPICLDEIHRIALENDQMTPYDNISTGLYREIETALNREIIDQYNRTPPSKRIAYDTSRLFIGSLDQPGHPPVQYFLFSALKGTVKRAADILLDRQRIGRVIRAAYRFTSGRVCGLGAIHLPDLPHTKIPDQVAEGGHNLVGSKMLCQNIDQENPYEIEIYRVL